MIVELRTISMSKLRILPNIVGRLLKPGKLFSKVKVLSVLDHHVVKIPAVKAFEFEKLSGSSTFL